jgi:hypothetical protein
MDCFTISWLEYFHTGLAYQQPQNWTPFHATTAMNFKLLHGAQVVAGKKSMPKRKKKD